jgi:hypothetical protein
LKAKYFGSLALFHNIAVNRLSLKYVIKRSYAEGYTAVFSNLRDFKIINKTSIKEAINKLSFSHFFYDRVFFVKKKNLQNKNFFNFIKIKFFYYIINISFMLGIYFYLRKISKNKKLQNWVNKKNYI